MSLELGIVVIMFAAPVLLSLSALTGATTPLALMRALAQATTAENRGRGQEERVPRR